MVILWCVRASKCLGETVQISRFVRAFTALLCNKHHHRKHTKWTTIGPPAKRHLNGVSLVV